MAELCAIDEIDPRLARLDDWQLMVSLGCRGFKAVVTNDSRMLYTPRVIQAARMKKLSIVAVEALGHDPVRATGALLLDLPAIVRKLPPSGCVVFKIRRNNPQPIKPGKITAERAKRARMDLRDLLREERFSGEEKEDPLV